MSSIVSFVGWHDSSRMTLVGQVVTELKELGYRVGVIKSLSDPGISFDAPGTDIFEHKVTEADSVMLVALSQLVLQQDSGAELSLQTLAYRYFPDVDIVVVEGFAKAKNIPKIEVIAGNDQNLREGGNGVVAVATNVEGVAGDYVFRLDEAAEIALFIEKRFLHRDNEEIMSLLVNGNRISIKKYIQEALAGTVVGFVKTLKLNEDIEEIELRFRLKKGD